MDNAPTIAFARRLAARRRPMWIRFVLVPGLTDDLDDLAKTAAFAAELGNVERVEVLPFHQMGRYKWERLGLKYQLDNVEPPSVELVERALDVLRKAGLQSVLGVPERAGDRSSSARAVADAGDFCGHRPGLRHRPDFGRRVLARHRRGPVRGIGAGRDCAEGGAAGACRIDRPRHVSLRHRHSIRPAVFCRPARRWPEVECAGRRCGVGSLAVAVGGDCRVRRYHRRTPWACLPAR